MYREPSFQEVENVPRRPLPPWELLALDPAGRTLWNRDRGFGISPTRL
jgi:hypothetical protein